MRWIEYYMMEWIDPLYKDYTTAMFVSHVIGAVVTGDVINPMARCVEI